MLRGWARKWLLCSFALALPFGAGCDALTVHSFAGTVMELSLSGSIQPTPSGQHIELWARSRYNDIIRLTNGATGPATYGLQIRNAITFDDQCMIDDKGNLLTSPDGYHTVTIAGVTQTPEQQAQQVKNRIAQVTATTIGGAEANNLLAVVPYDGMPTPTIPATASAADRLAACHQWWASDPNAYSPNPAQLTAPIHGILLGLVAYTTTTPPASYDGFRIDTPINLAGVQELWMTTESTPVDSVVPPPHGGPVLVDGPVDRGGRDVVHFDLVGKGVSGSAALYTTLDQDPDQF